MFSANIAEKNSKEKVAFACNMFCFPNGKVMIFAWLKSIEAHLIFFVFCINITFFSIFTLIYDNIIDFFKISLKHFLMFSIPISSCFSFF